MENKIGFVNICHADYVCEAVDNMAEKAVNELKSRGFSVQYVIQPVIDHIGAVNSARELINQDVKGIILFLGTWIECPVAMAIIREVEHLPMCLWGFPMFMENGVLSSTGSYVSFAMFKGTMDRVGFRYKHVLGYPGDPETINTVASFCKAATAAQNLKRTRIGLVGYTSMGIYPGTFDHVFLRVKIGPEVEQLDSYTVIRMAEAIPNSECKDTVEYLKSRARIRLDVDQDDLYKASRLILALKNIVKSRDLQSINVKCQYEFSKEYGMVMCVPMSALAEFGIVASCEGDMMNTVSMVILNLLSGQIVTYGDVMHHDNNIVKLSSCGFIPFSMGEDEDREIRKFFPHPGFHGIQNSFVPKPGRVTVMRLVEDRCDYHMVYLTGEGLKTELRQGYMPALDVRLDGDVRQFAENYSGQHYAICYGDLSEEIDDLARILGIKAIRI